MRLPALLLLVGPTWFGCAEAPDADAMAAAPPPGGLELEVGNAVLGEDLELRVEYGTPGATVTFAYGPRAGAGPCVLGGLCLGVVRPSVLGSSVVDGAGVAELIVRIPGGVRAASAAFQAVMVEPGAPAMASDVEVRTIQADAPSRVRVNPNLPGSFQRFQPDAVQVEGDTVFVEVAYSGGCARHDFALVWDGQFGGAGAVPVAELSLWHDPNRDMCQAWIMETRRFDLAPIRSAWPFGEPESCALDVAGYPATYTF